MPSIILIRGGGDLATGVAVRLLRCGLRIVITELPSPLVIRRTVSFAEAVFSGETTVEGFTAQKVKDSGDILSILSVIGKQRVPILVDPGCDSARSLRPSVIVDARMIKSSPEPIGYISQLYIGLGPGFMAGRNCQVAIETRRGHYLGRVLHVGEPDHDTGQPEDDPRRVLRAPCDGLFLARVDIGTHVEANQLIAEIKNINQETGESGFTPVEAPLAGTLRGLLHSGLPVTRNMKIGDVDVRDDPKVCNYVSDKSLAIGGGVLEVIISNPVVRQQLWV